MKTCPRCGKQYPDSEGFCETDGAALVEAMALPPGRLTSAMTEQTHPEQGLECPVCGGKALPGEVRCNYCGARLRVDGPQPALATGIDDSESLPNSPSGPQEFGDTTVNGLEADTPPKNHRLVRIFGFSGAAVIALAAGAWLALYLSKNHPFPQAPATPSAAATSAPMVDLAKETPLRIQADVAGALPRDVNSLLKVFDDNKAGLANVYGNALNSDPAMKDGMVVRLHILPNGSVDNGAVPISTSGNPSFDAEVVEAMTSWKFASINGGGVSADYHVIFAPSAIAVPSAESELKTKLASLSPNEPPEYAFSPSGASPTAVAVGSPSATASAAAGGTSSVPGSSVAVSTPAAAPEPTTVAGLPPAPSLPAPERRPSTMTAAPSRVHRHRRPPREMAALPPKPSLLERVNGELRGNRRLRRVQAYTNGSVVTIFGKVFDDKDRSLAERTVRNTDGVSAVVNNLMTDTQQWQQNQTLINQALQNAGLNNVEVKVIGASAYLSGQVKTDLDRERAVTVAQSAAPVKVRENLITVKIGNMLGF